MLKQRQTIELEYEKEMLEDKRALNTTCGVASAMGAGIVISAAAAPATAGTTTTIAAILSVISAIQIISAACLDNDKISQIEDELKNR